MPWGVPGGLGCLWSLGGELCRVSLWAVGWDVAHPEESSLSNSGTPHAPFTAIREPFT